MCCLPIRDTDGACTGGLAGCAQEDPMVLQWTFTTPLMAVLLKPQFWSRHPVHPAAPFFTQPELTGAGLDCSGSSPAGVRTEDRSLPESPVASCQRILHSPQLRPSRLRRPSHRLLPGVDGDSPELTAACLTRDSGEDGDLHPPLAVQLKKNLLNPLFFNARKLNHQKPRVQN